MEPQVTHPFRSQHARSRRSTAGPTRRFPARAASRLTSLAVLCLLAAAGTPHGAVAGPVSVNPGLDLEVRQDQLPSTNSSDEGWIARLSPRLALARMGVGNSLEIMGVRSFDSNQRVSGPVWVGDEAAMRFIASPAPHSYLSANAGYVSSRDPLENKAAIPVTFSESAISTGGANLELWRLETRYDVRSHTYESPGHLDGLSQNWEATAIPFRRPDTQGTLGARGRDVRIDHGPVLNTTALTAGMRRTHFAGLSSEIEVGAAATRDPVHTTNSWDLAVVAGATAERGALRQPCDLRFRFMRDVATTGFAEASVPARRRRFAVRWEQDLGAEGGRFHDATLSKYLTFEARDTVMSAYVLTVEGSFGQTRSFFQNSSWLRTNRVWASLSRSVLPWLWAALDYSFVNQDGDPSAPSWEFQRNRVGLRLTMGAQ